MADTIRSFCYEKGAQKEVDDTVEPRLVRANTRSSELNIQALQRAVHL